MVQSARGGGIRHYTRGFDMTSDAIDVKEAMRSFREDALFFNDHHREFLRLYPDQWVAVYGKQVAGADADLGRLLEDLKARGYPLRSLVVRRVETNPMKLIV